LVEIIKGQETSEESFGIVKNLVKSFGKVRILINIFGGYGYTRNYPVERMKFNEW
jgi:3-hydroxyacyl-CoA dehydrogenase